MKELVDLICDNHRMLDIIRLRKGTDFNIETLKDDLGISRTTADKVFQLLSSNKKYPLISRQNKGLFINGTIGYFLGISIGSQHIRIVLLDLNFVPVECKNISINADIQAINRYYPEESTESSYTFKTPRQKGNSLHQLRNLISEIVSKFLSIHNSQQGDQLFRLLGIGFGVSGPVDYCEKIWLSSSRITHVTNITLLDLVGYENEQIIKKEGIFISLDNNAKTAAISEYQFLMEKYNGFYNKDVALLYIGSGVGFAAVIDQKLIRGSHNMFGELCNAPLIIKEDNEPDNEHNITSTNVEDVLENCNWSDLSLYLPYVLKMINGILGIDAFILVGHSISKSENLIPLLMNQRTIFTVESTQRYCKYEIGRKDTSTSAVGAAIESYLTLCNYNNDDGERMNLANEIKWTTLF